MASESSRNDNSAANSNDERDLFQRAITDEKENISIPIKVRKMLSYFGDNTTFHGVKRSVIRSLFRRSIWTVLVLASVGWALYEFYNIVQSYLTYPITTTITLKQESRLLFPAITICNLNPLRKSRLSEQVQRDLEAKHLELLQNYPPLDHEVIKAIVLRDTEISDREQAYHSISDMLQFCNFNEEICKATDFTPTIGTSSGQCFTFNHGGAGDQRYTSKAGSWHGLILQILLQQDEYLSVTTSAGIKVIVHGQGEPPFPEDGGIQVGPGHVTSIALKKVDTERIPAPYGTCFELSSNSRKSLYTERNNVYTQNGCKKSCYQLWLYEVCECCDMDLPCDTSAILNLLNKKITSSGPILYCNISNKEDFICVNHVTEQFIEDDTKCSRLCPPVCKGTHYETLVSSAVWPSDSYLNLYLKGLNQTTREEKISKIRKDNLRLEIYFHSLENVLIVDQPATDGSKVFSNVGGTLGLFLGFSILTGIEILELFLDFIILFAIRFYKKYLSA